MYLAFFRRICAFSRERLILLRMMTIRKMRTMRKTRRITRVDSAAEPLSAIWQPAPKLGASLHVNMVTSIVTMESMSDEMTTTMSIKLRTSFTYALPHA